MELTPEGRLLTPAGWQRGRILIQDGHISSIDSSLTTAHDDLGLPIILPGFVDLHVHGGGGADVMDGGDALSAIARTHARYGTTSMLATTMTAPLEEIDAALRSVQAHMDRARPAGAARVLGVQLEGPYINRHKLGSQPDFTAPALLEDLHRRCDLAPIRVLTLAPEIEGHDEIIRFLVQRGIRAQIGHSSGTYDDAVAALKLGASGFTHLYNAMIPAPFMPRSGPFRACIASLMRQQLRACRKASIASVDSGCIRASPVCGCPMARSPAVR
jgi:N-acetylglucosamine-6-phosphate deacetylase